jgi:hypothetical protein
MQARAYLPPEMSFFIQSTRQQAVTRSLLVAACCLIGKYIQQADVCMLIVRKWAVAKQQGQLQTFFKKQKDGVLIFSKTDSADNLTSTSPLSIV